MTATCQKEHRHDVYFNRLPKDQGRFGRHVCAGCAYERGYQLGFRKVTAINIESEFVNLLDSQASSVRHKSPYVAFALGYADGLFNSY